MASLRSSVQTNLGANIDHGVSEMRNLLYARRYETITLFRDTLYGQECLFNNEDVGNFMKRKQLFIERLYLLLAHLTGSGRESSLPVVSSVVASGRLVVTLSMSMGMARTDTTPSATTAQIPCRNFSISPTSRRYLETCFLCCSSSDFLRFRRR